MAVLTTQTPGDLPPSSPHGRPRRRPRHSRHSRRTGLTAVLAMLFLCLFAVLAIGFFASSSISVQTARTDVQIAESAVAAESGLNYVRYQLSRARIAPGTAPDRVLIELYDHLSTAMTGTGNLGARAVGFDGHTIRIPSAPDDYVSLAPEGGRFRVSITASVDGRISAQVTGRHRDDAIRRTVQLGFNAAPRDGLFDYAVAAKGQIVTSGSSHVYGHPVKATARMLSADLAAAYPIVIGGKEVGGNLSIVSATADVDIQSGTVAGATEKADILQNHVRRGVPEPEFPRIDVGLFTRFVSKPYTDPSVQSSADHHRTPGAVHLAMTSLGGGNDDAAGELVAMRRALGSYRGRGGAHSRDADLFRVDLAPTDRPGRLPALFTQGNRPVLLAAKPPDNGNGNGNGGGGNGGGGGGAGGGGGNGVTYTNCYVPPNADPTFNAKDVIEGVLYVQAPNQVKFAGGCTIRGVVVVQNDPTLAPEQTTLTFRGNVDAYGVETLAVAKHPILSKMTGTFIAAENALVDFRGNFSSVVSGSIVAAGVTFGGSAGGAINGAIIGMSPKHPVTLSNANSSPILFVGTAKTNRPTGLNFTAYLKPDPATYTEIEK